MSEHVCPYCNRLYRVPKGQGNRKCCFKQKCIVKHEAKKRERDKETHRKYNRDWKARSYRQEIKRDPRQGQKLIFCRGCHTWKWSYFEPFCAECREVKRCEVNTDWIYQADSSRWGDSFQ